MSEGFWLSVSECSFRGKMGRGMAEPAACHQQGRGRNIGPVAGVGLQSHKWATWEEKCREGRTQGKPQTGSSRRLMVLLRGLAKGHVMGSGQSFPTWALDSST